MQVAIQAGSHNIILVSSRPACHAGGYAVNIPSPEPKHLATFARPAPSRRESIGRTAPRSYAILGWFWSAGRDRRWHKASNSREDNNERITPAGTERRTRRQRRTVPEPARIHPEGAFQPQPERLG